MLPKDGPKFQSENGPKRFKNCRQRLKTTRNDPKRTKIVKKSKTADFFKALPCRGGGVAAAAAAAAVVGPKEPPLIVSIFRLAPLVLKMVSVQAIP